MATSGAALRRPGRLPREAPAGEAPPRAHAEPAREALPRMPSMAVNPAARTMRRIVGAFAGSAVLSAVLFAAIFLVHGGWQAAAAAGAIMAGIAAMTCFLVAVTLADRS